MQDTRDVLKEMLTENTGTNILDSGGSPRYDENGKYIGSEYGYGRAYERNRGRDFDAEPTALLSFKYDEISVILSAYHWLDHKLSYAKEEDLFFQEYAELPENEDKGWLELMQEFPEALAKDRDTEATGSYNEGSPTAHNSYNNEELLDTILQFVYFELPDDGEYVILQTHNGADVRGGYSTPRVFRCDEELGIFDYAKAVIYCEGVPGTGQVDLDGHIDEDVPTGEHHWYYAGSTGRTELQNYDIAHLAEGTRWERGKLFIDTEKDIGYCPLCGGVLKASSQ